jgi:hypothetical protein
MAQTENSSLTLLPHQAYKNSISNARLTWGRNAIHVMVLRLKLPHALGSIAAVNQGIGWSKESGSSMKVAH